MTDFIAAQADLILPELVGGYAPEYVFEQLVEDVPLPCILHWNQNHFVVCYKIKEEKNIWGRKTGDYKIYISDPAQNQAVFNKEEFLKCWLSTKKDNEDKERIRP